MPARSLLLPLSLAVLLLTTFLLTSCGPDESGEPERPAFIRGEVVVRYHKDLDHSAEEQVLSRHQLSRIASFAAVRVDHVAIDDGLDVADKIRELEQDPEVLYAPCPTTGTPSCGVCTTTGPTARPTPTSTRARRGTSRPEARTSWWR